MCGIRGALTLMTTHIKYYLNIFIKAKYCVQIKNCVQMEPNANLTIFSL
jgi:hypothetical protein